jgi:4'-phosphopantetheinyl transferase
MNSVTSSLDQVTVHPLRAEGSAALAWKSGPEALVIWPQEIHIWRASLDVPWSWGFDEALSLDDRVRADRFRFESDRRRFCIARASLKIILSRYLKTKPGRLQLETGDYGKPYLVNCQSAYDLRFNLSHSNRLALIAIARDREVGVDVEFMRPNFVTDDVVEHFFSRAEREEFATVAPAFKTQSFFNCWTRKEAYIKGRGEGLSCSLDEFDVSLLPGAPATLVESRLDPTEVSRWSMQDLFPAPGYAATVAVAGRYSRLVLWDLA